MGKYFITADHSFHDSSQSLLFARSQVWHASSKFARFRILKEKLQHFGGHYLDQNNLIFLKGPTTITYYEFKNWVKTKIKL